MNKMKTKIISILAIALLFTAIAFIPFNSALADADTAKQAASEVTKETGVKEQFGQSTNGERLLDGAKAEANQKLNNIADEANSGEDLPDSKKLFLKNLNNETSDARSQ